MSKGIERLLRKMIAPNADLRCTASEAMKDIYWTEKGSPSPRKNGFKALLTYADHRNMAGKVVSENSSSSILMNAAGNTTNLVDIILPWTSRVKEEKGDKSLSPRPHGRENKKSPEAKLAAKPALSNGKYTLSSFLTTHPKTGRIFQ